MRCVFAPCLNHATKETWKFRGEILKYAFWVQTVEGLLMLYLIQAPKLKSDESCVCVCAQLPDDDDIGQADKLMIGMHM